MEKKAQAPNEAHMREKYVANSRMSQLSQGREEIADKTKGSKNVGVASSANTQMGAQNNSLCAEEVDTFSFGETFLLAAVVASFSLLVYWDETAMNGQFVYDDAGTVKRNPLMNHSRPYWDILTHDYWGELLVSKTSHKSFRLNYESVELEPYQYHVTNVCLNSIVSGLAVFAAAIVFEHARSVTLLASFLFAAHPIHTEAVSNVTGRAEVLMGLFYLLGFLLFVRNREVWITTNVSPFLQAALIYLLPLVFATLSMFSKENGLMLVVTCGLYDFMEMDMNVQELLANPSRNDDSIHLHNRIRRFWIRTIFAASCFLGIGFFRYKLNGDNDPIFVYDQNPAAFHEDRITRILSINMVYTLYLRSMILPTDLCCDWSGLSIQLVTDPLNDGRMVDIILLHILFWGGVLHVLFFKKKRRHQTRLERMWSRAVIMGMLGFMICPFFLSSNLIIAVGTMKAERLAYFPSFGFVLLLSAFMDTINYKICKLSMDRHLLGLHLLTHIFVWILLIFYVTKTKERNLDWSNALRLWESAYTVNKKSAHTQYNYGLELAQVKRSEDAAAILQKAHESDPEDVTTIFVFSIVLRSLGRCLQADPMIDEGLRLVEERRHIADPARRYHYKRDKSNLLSIKALCSDDIGFMGSTLYEAIMTDPTNEYAVNRGKELLEKVEFAKSNGISPQNIPLNHINLRP